MTKKTIKITYYAIAIITICFWVVFSCGHTYAPGAQTAPGRSQYGKVETPDPGGAFHQPGFSKHNVYLTGRYNDKPYLVSLNEHITEYIWLSRIPNIILVKDNYMNIGYARVSRTDQDLQRQVTALEQAGCERIYTDKISGAKKSRPELDKMMAELQPGDCLIVAKLDRFGRSISHLCNCLDDFTKRKIGFKSLNDGFDTTTANGRLLLHVLAAMAEFERELVRERTKDGLKQARANGVILGRPKSDIRNKLDIFVNLLNSGKEREDIQNEMSISRGQYYRYWNLSRNNVVSQNELKI